MHHVIRYIETLCLIIENLNASTNVWNFLNEKLLCILKTDFSAYSASDEDFPEKH